MEHMLFSKPKAMVRLALQGSLCAEILLEYFGLSPTFPGDQTQVCILRGMATATPSHTHSCTESARGPGCAAVYLSFPRSACCPNRSLSRARRSGRDGTSPALTTTVHSQHALSTTGLSVLDEASPCVSGICREMWHHKQSGYSGLFISRGDTDTTPWLSATS